MSLNSKFESISSSLSVSVSLSLVSDSVSVSSDSSESVVVVSGVLLADLADEVVRELGVGDLLGVFAGVGDFDGVVLGDLLATNFKGGFCNIFGSGLTSSFFSVTGFLTTGVSFTVFSTLSGTLISRDCNLAETSFFGSLGGVSSFLGSAGVFLAHDGFAAVVAVDVVDAGVDASFNHDGFDVGLALPFKGI